MTRSNRAFPFRTALPFILLLFWAAGCGRDPAPDTEAARAEPAADPVDATPAPVRDTVLEAALRAAVTRIEGTVGVAVLHLQRDVHASVNGDRRFGLASVSKLPIAYAAMKGHHTGPADSVAVSPDDRAPGETPFAPGMTVPMARLVERSLAYSDNTASDVLLRVAGGPEEVNWRIRALGVDHVRVDRTMRQLFEGGRGRPDSGDDRDTGTAEGMVALLAALHRSEALGPEAHRLLLEALQAAVTGPNRIRAGVPPGTTVGHKTGTLGPLTHDIGIITLADRGGDVALAVLVESYAPLPDRERVIAAASRAVWEHFAGDGGDGGGMPEAEP